MCRSTNCFRYIMLFSWYILQQWFQTWGDRPPLVWVRNITSGCAKNVRLNEKKLSIYSSLAVFFVLFCSLSSILAHSFAFLHKQRCKHVFDCLKTCSWLYYSVHNKSESYYFCKAYSSIIFIYTSFVHVYFSLHIIIASKLDRI